MFTGSTKLPPAKTPKPERLDEVYAALRRGLQSYLQVHQLELDSLGQQIRDNKRNGRLGSLYELDKQVKAIERFMRRLEFHLSKVEELYDAYSIQRRLRDGASKMVAAFNSATGSREARESLSEANKGYKECTEHMCSLESEFESQMGEFHVKMKGLAGFARLCAGDQYEVLMRYGRQRWRLRGRVEVSNKQIWDSEEYIFLPLVTELLSIKVTELKSLANHVVVGSVSCEMLDLFCPLPQTLAVDINDLGTVKLNLEVTWSPFDKDDQISSSSTLSKRLLSNQSPPDTPSMREQVFYLFPHFFVCCGSVGMCEDPHRGPGIRALGNRNGEHAAQTMNVSSSETYDNRSMPVVEVVQQPKAVVTVDSELECEPADAASLLKRQGEMENGTVWSNSSESSDDSSSPALAPHTQRLTASNRLQTTLTSQLAFTPHKSSASTPSLSSNQEEEEEEEETEAAEVFSQTEPVLNGHLQSSCSTDRLSVQSAELSDTSADLSCSCPDVSCGPPGSLTVVREDAAEDPLPKTAQSEAEESSTKAREGHRGEASEGRPPVRESEPLGEAATVPFPTSVSFTQELETALESFDFLNCADIEDDDEEEEADKHQQEGRSQEEEDKEGEREEEDKEGKEEDKEGEEEEGKQQHEEEHDGQNAEKASQMEGEDYSGGSNDDDDADADSLDILMEAPEGFRNCDEECLSESQESSVEDVQDLSEIEMPHNPECGEEKGAEAPGEKTPPGQCERPSTPSHLATRVF